MRCPACQHENRDGAKFCEECATPLKRQCASCRAELRPSARFCDECGAPAAGTATSRPHGADGAQSARTVVSIIFADLVGSTALHERLDAESVRAFMESYYAAMRGAVEAHGGRVTQVMGDGVKAVFGAPRVAEDDAIRAVRAGVAMQEAFRSLADEQRGRVGKTGLRVAVNTGEVVSDGESEIIGDPVNVAARLQEQGRDGDVVIGGSTQRIVAALVTLDRLGSFALKGRSEQVEAYRVVSLDAPAGAAKAAFVGRDEELARIAAVYDTAVAKPAAALAVLLGSPGLGKSRLIDEFARRLGDSATLLLAHCDAAGGATFAPLVAALRERLGLEDGAGAEAVRAAIEAVLPAGDAERARIAGGVAALLAGSPASPEETFFVVRRLLAALAQQKPVVLVIDDLHWAESLLLDLVEHLVQWGSGVPLFVLVGARPELRELRSSLVTPGSFVGDVLTLSGLDAGAAMRLAAGVIGAADLPAALAAKLLASSEGNPLFVRELVKMLVQEGVLHREGERWVASAALADLEMPPTIHALLAARIERLRPEERAVLERAAVVGRHFSKSAVAALLSQTADLDARLEALRRSELIERDTGWFLGEPVLRFHHVLIRDAAYRRVLKGTRAELHARLAGWIEAKASDAAEHDETIGWHLEQAQQHLAELGPLDAAGIALGERAARRLAAAGRRALARDDVPVAGSLLGRALGCLPADAAERADLALDWCEALLSAGNVAAAGGAIAELARAGGDSPRLRAWHTCFAGQLTALTEPQSLNATVEAVAAAAEDLAALEDAAGEAKAHFVHAQALMRLGKVGACEAALDRALAAARRAGDRRRANAVLAGAPLAALWGPSPVTRASGRCLDVVRVLRITQGAPAVEAVALSCQGVLEALRGRTDAARRMLASSRKLVEELGIAHRLFEADAFAGRIAAMEGDAAAAERLLRGAYEGLRDLGLGIDAARAGALLARALLAQGRAAEAEALSHESEALAGDDLQASIAWRGVRAEALAQRGEHAAPIDLAQAAVAIAAATDALLDHADARMALAAALRAAGRGAEADAEEHLAIELWEAKGATLLAERARRKDAREPSATPVAAPRLVPSQRRRVLPNAATRNAALLDAAIVAHDADALLVLFSDDMHISDHTTQIEFGRQGGLASWRSLIGATEPACHHEPLATLGDSLGLFRLRLSASGFSGGRLDVGAYEKDEIHSVEADAQGRRRGGEVWATANLDEAVARLYERYAELLPEGPGRTRAAAVARSLGTMLLVPGELKAAFLAPDFASTDHRQLGTWSGQGATAFVDHLRALHEVADDVAIRTRDVLALGPNALLILRMHSGTERIGGGGYERPFLVLFVTDAEGRLERGEWFDAERGAEALARFDALVAGAEPQRRALHRVRPNAASAAEARLSAAFGARNDAAAEAILDDRLEVTDHRWHLSYGRDGYLGTRRRMMQPEDAELGSEPIATLGDFLSLSRLFYTASGAGGRFDVGAHATEFVKLVEVDLSGRIRRIEVFAADHLADAVVRLYERSAALLPESPERTRAAATAQSMTMLRWSNDPDRLPALLAPDFEGIDHRPLSLWSVRGAEAYVDHIRALQQVADNIVFRWHEILALRPDAVLARVMNSGTERVGGGAYERPFLSLFVTGADGRIARAEWFADDREAEALARFEALTGGAPMSQPARRRVRANVATRSFERFEAALAARDADALAQLFEESLHVVHHPSGASYGRREHLGTWRSALRAARFEFRQEILASLGDALALDHHVITVEGLSESDLAGFGLSEFDEISLLEVDERGRWLRSEIFSPDHLGDAVAHLYERYAARLPEGAARARAEATARTVAVVAPGGFDADRYAEVFRPDAEIADRQLLGWGSEVGPERLFRVMAGTREVADQLVSRPQDVLALTHDALLLRWLVSGVGRESGGAVEWAFLRLFVFGADGRVARYELFDAGRKAEALARFEALTGGGEAEPAPDPFENAAARADRALMHCFNTRDWDGVLALAAPGLIFDERRRLLHNTCGREIWLEQFRLMFDVPKSRFTSRLLATRGERLSLHLHRFEGEVAHGGGPLAMDDHFALHEVDPEGRIVAIVLFDEGDQGAANAELDARFEAGESALHPRASAAARAFRRGFSSRAWDAMARLFGPEFTLHDHRPVGFGDVVGAAACVDLLRSLPDLAPDAELRVDHLRTAERGFLFQCAWQGTRDGGAFETPFVMAMEVAAEGVILRADAYGPEQLEQARARFAELSRAAPAQAPFANAAARTYERRLALFAVRDWEGLAQSLAPGFRSSDRRKLVLLELDREQYVAFTRSIGDLASTGHSLKLLATRGDRLALHWLRIDLEDRDVGPSEIESLVLVELDERGDDAAGEARFDADDLDAAYAELDARFDAGEGTAHAGTLAAWRRQERAWATRDWEALSATRSPGLVFRDHRLLGWGTPTSHGVSIDQINRSLVDLAPDVHRRHDHVRLGERGILEQMVQVGTRDGGVFENVFLAVYEWDAEGRCQTTDNYDVDRFDLARARFEELSRAAPASFANAATRVYQRILALFAARDWERFAQQLAPGYRASDRRKLVLLELDREQYVEFIRSVGDMASTRHVQKLLATRGEQLALHWQRIDVEDREIGPSEIESLQLNELDGRGDYVAMVRFDAEDLEAASAELDARYAAGEAAAHPVAAAWLAGYLHAFAARDWAAMAALFAPDLVAENHRLVGWGTLSGPAALLSTLQAQVELAPDTRERVDHVRLCERGVLLEYAWCGTHEGGEFENLWIVGVELDALGRGQRAEVWEPEQQAKALAWFDEVAARSAAGAHPFANAASRAVARMVAVGRANGWQSLAPVLPESFRFHDRRRLALLDLDREGYAEYVRSISESRSMQVDSELIATRGERLALERQCISLAGGDVGASELVNLSVWEIDKRGDCIALVRFDEDDLDAAYAELETRWRVGEAAGHAAASTWLRDFGAALVTRDWDAVAACYTPDFVGEDHRLVGWGTLRGPAAFMETLRAMVALAPDVSTRIDHVRSSRRALVLDCTWVGTRDGGAFESPFIVAMELDAQGRALRSDFYDPHHAERALARFAELCAAGR